MTKKNWIGLNLVVLIVIGLLGWQLHVSVQRFHEENSLAKIQPVRDIKQSLRADGGLLAPQAPRRYNPAEFSVIANQNLFSDVRGKQEEKVDQVQTIPELNPRPVLVGVTLSGNQRLASMIDPSIPNNRRSQTKRLGDVYKGYTIVDITENQMVLQYASRTETIPLFDSTKPKTAAGRTPLLVARVVRFGGGAAPGAAATPPPAGAAAATPGAARPPQGVAGAAGVPGAGGAAQPGIVQVVGQPGNQPQTNTAQPARNWNETTDSQGRRVIRTPFGDIIRDKPNK